MASQCASDDLTPRIFALNLSPPHLHFGHEYAIFTTCGRSSVVEHLPSKQMVARSIRVARSNRERIRTPSVSR